MENQGYYCRAWKFINLFTGIFLELERIEIFLVPTLDESYQFVEITWLADVLADAKGAGAELVLIVGQA
jgi:hypothetical protein